jgi:hypothetical protein
MLPLRSLPNYSKSADARCRMSRRYFPTSCKNSTMANTGFMATDASKNNSVGNSPLAALKSSANKNPKELLSPPVKKATIKQKRAVSKVQYDSGAKEKTRLLQSNKPYRATFGVASNLDTLTLSNRIGK